LNEFLEVPSTQSYDGGSVGIAQIC